MITLTRPNTFSWSEDPSPLTDFDFSPDTIFTSFGGTPEAGDFMVYMIWAINDGYTFGSQPSLQISRNGSVHSNSFAKGSGNAPPHDTDAIVASQNNATLSGMTGDDIAYYVYTGIIEYDPTDTWTVSSLNTVTDWGVHAGLIRPGETGWYLENSQGSKSGTNREVFNADGTTGALDFIGYEWYDGFPPDTTGLGEPADDTGKDWLIAASALVIPSGTSPTVQSSGWSSPDATQTVIDNYGGSLASGRDYLVNLALFSVEAPVDTTPWTHPFLSLFDMTNAHVYGATESMVAAVSLSEQAPPPRSDFGASPALTSRKVRLEELPHQVTSEMRRRTGGSA